jgi:hypothetical protein
MLVARGGRERTEAAYRSLLRSAGFQVEGILPAASDFSVIVATPGVTGHTRAPLGDSERRRFTL